MSYQKRDTGVSAKIYNLFSIIDTQTYDKVVPSLEYWIELALSQQFTTAAKLVEHVSAIAWTEHGSPTSLARFLKEFRDSPRRSTHARSFVNELCTRTFWWFTAASAEDLQMSWSVHCTVARGGGGGFMEAASFVGHLIEHDLLDHKLVRQHLIKPLILHYYPSPGTQEEIVRINAIFRLFVAAGNTLVQGLLEPDDARVCFDILETQLSKPDVIARLSTTKIEELRELIAVRSQRNDGEGRDDGAEAEECEGEDGEADAGTAAEVETPIAFPPHDLPATANFYIPSPILQAFEPSAAFHNLKPFPDALTEDRLATVSSPTLSVSTISDLTPTEFGEDIGESSGERSLIRHETFYLEDGNVEIVCGQTIFRVHSSVISFSSPNLRNILSSSAFLSAPMPEGCPRVVFKDDPEDFSVLLRMIYTPGFLVRNEIQNFTTFASLLRMTTKYGFPDIREALVEALKGAYPTKWEDFETAKVLGEDVFSSPEPHPNAVLNLFLEQRVKFALPFAAYRAGLGGPFALASEKPGATLPRLTLASIIHGTGVMRRAMMYAMQTPVFTWDPEVCDGGTCVMIFTPHTKQMETLKKIFGVIVKKSEDDLLSPLSFENLLCVGCERPLVSAHRDCCRRLVWERLPNLIGWESWESV